MFDNNEWLNQVHEPVIDPLREIVDPHHHLWPPGPLHYDLPELLSDTGSGNETAAHLLEDGRITIMFCAFEGAPNILRLYGTAKEIRS